MLSRFRLLRVCEALLLTAMTNFLILAAECRQGTVPSKVLELAPRLASVAVIFLGMASIGAWLALYGPAEGFSGGIPLLPRGINRPLARTLFGLGALVSPAAVGLVLRQLTRSRL